MAFTREEVAEIYVATFNRAADADGLDYWVNDSGFTEIEDVASSLFDSAEAKEMYPDGTSSTEMVESAYQNLFGRTAEAEGLNYWTSELDSGSISQNLMLQAMIDGAQDSETGMDATYMENKTTIGLEFADSNQNDLEMSKTIMADVTDDMTSVELAQASIASMPDEDFIFTSEYLEGTTLFEAYDGDADGIYEGLISMEFNNGTLTTTNGEDIQTLTYEVDEDGVLALSDGAYISTIKDMGGDKLATAWYDNDLDSALNASMSSSHKDESFKFIFEDIEALNTYISSSAQESEEDHGNSPVDKEFSFSEEFLNEATLYNVYDSDGDGIYEGLKSMLFSDGSLTTTDDGVVQTLTYSVNEAGTISLSDGTYISALVNISEENKIASAWDIDLDDVLSATGESAQDDGIFEYMFTDLDSATGFIA